MQRHPSRWILKPSEDPRVVWKRWLRGGGPPAGQQQEVVAPRAAAAAAAAAAVDAAAATATQHEPAAIADGQWQALEGSYPPPSKRQRVAGGGDALPAAPQQAQQQQQLEQQAGCRAWVGGAESIPWLSHAVPGGFMDTLPRCMIDPHPFGSRLAPYPNMLPLGVMPMQELLLDPEVGKEMLVSAGVGRTFRRCVRPGSREGGCIWQGLTWGCMGVFVAVAKEVS